MECKIKISAFQKHRDEHAAAEAAEAAGYVPIPGRGWRPLALDGLRRADGGADALGPISDFCP
jgi:hypothetical protein